MEKKSLEQALEERRDTQASVEAARQQQWAKDAKRYMELIRSGSGEKAAVDEVLKLADGLGKSESQMHQDIANIEAAKDLAGQINALAGCETALTTVAELRPAVAERVRKGLHELQRHFNMLNHLLQDAGDRAQDFKSLRVHLSQLKASHAELLADVEVPDASIAFAPCDVTDFLPDMVVWQEDYAELKTLLFGDVNATGATKPA